jgi:hypothetical protein
VREGVEEDRPQSHFDKASWTEHHATGKRRALWQRPPSVRCQTICSLLIIFVRSVTDRGQFSKVFNDTLGARVARQAASASVPDSKVQSRDPAGRAWIERNPREPYTNRCRQCKGGQMQTVQGGPEEQSRTCGCQSGSVEDQPQCPGL